MCLKRVCGRSKLGRLVLRDSSWRPELMKMLCQVYLKLFSIDSKWMIFRSRKNNLNDFYKSLKHWCRFCGIAKASLGLIMIQLLILHWQNRAFWRRNWHEIVNVICKNIVNPHKYPLSWYIFLYILRGGIVGPIFERVTKRVHNCLPASL